ncbi:MAG: prepilin peptidase [Desulfuromusa sp.]
MSLPALDYQINKSIQPEPLHQGLDRSMHQLVGLYQRRHRLVQEWQNMAKAILQQSYLLQNISDQELKQQLLQLKQDYRRHKKNRVSRQQAFALIAEVAFRTLGMRPYEVQILAAIALSHGYLAEMATGEGKSLTACFPAILAAWQAKPCHIITVNDYLAERDTEELAPLYRFCDVSTDWVSSTMDTAARQRGYAADVVYTTSKELLADFLRDQLQLKDGQSAERQLLRQTIDLHSSSKMMVVMRGIDTAIVDEADSVLIDEAVTPLIISQAQENGSFQDAIVKVQKISETLTAGIDYQVDRRYREINLTKSAEATIAKTTVSLPGIFQNKQRCIELIQTALSAKEFYQQDDNYTIVDNKVIIVDEFTGRMMPGRSWRQGLHQAIEARENLPLTDPNETLAQLSFQNFFRMFRNLCGLTGTAREVAAEFWDIYKLPVVSIPTHRPCQRKILKSQFHPDQESKWWAICTEVASCQQSGQPVLVGTRSLFASNKLAEMLTQQGISFQLLNALNHKQEAEIIASAGQLKQVTIATNMAGRGADIKLGEGVIQLGGLHVILSEHHESERIDRQLLGRCARQGDPGSVRTYASLEDDLLQKNGSKLLLRLLKNKNSKRQKGTYLFNKLIIQAQNSAQRTAYQQRKNVLETDKRLDNLLSFAPSTTK